MEEVEKQSPQYLEVFNTVYSSILKLEPDAQKRVFEAVAALLGIHLGIRSVSPGSTFPAGSPKVASFSENREMSPKEFVMEKRPTSDVQRVAVLGYYLTHYRSTPHFKTLDISKLNTEAAQPKFSNAAKAVDNAATRGYLVAATKGNKQLSAIGERFVEALPDQAAGREMVAASRPRRKMKRQGRQESAAENDGEN